MNDSHGTLTWGVSQITDAPNVIVMGCLIVLLTILERRHKRMRIRVCILALAIVFFDELVWLLPNAETTLRTFTHTTRLIGQVLAGLSFLFYEAQPSSRFTRLQRFVLHNAPTLVLLQVLYGLNVRSALPYVLCALAAILIQVVLHGRERSLTWYMASLPALWVGVALFALAGDFRTAAYFACGCIFAAATRNFWVQLENAYVGRAVVTVSLLLWAASLLVHPWVMAHRQWTALAEQTWAMQKFIVTFGMVVVLFEEESREHEHLSQHDNLTGLANRRRLQQTLHADIAHGRASVLLIDLDGFKQVNDVYGHAAGDAVLQEIARRLEELCEPGDIIARVGGDEFILASRHDLKGRQNAVLDTIARNIELPGGSLARVTGSVGLANYPADAPGGNGSDAVSTLLNVADLRMYTSKHRQPTHVADRLRPAELTPQEASA